MTTLLLVNPVAGQGRAARVAEEVRLAAQSAWGDVTRIDSSGPGDAVPRIRKAMGQGVERLLVVGGDGTIHEAANGLLTSGVDPLPPIGIVPAGTGNDYAKIAGTVGMDPAHAVDRLARGRIRYLDVGHAWDEYFLNAVGIGFDAEVARRMNSGAHGRGLPAYLGAVFKVLGSFRPFRAEIEAGEHSLAEPLTLLEIGIGNVVGGGFHLTPGAEPDDGLFDVCAIRSISTPGLLLRLPLTIPGWHTRLKHVRTFRTAQLTVIGHDGPLIAQFDGEFRTREGRMEIRLEPARLPFMVIR